MSTDNFIDDTLVGVEIESEAGVAEIEVSVSSLSYSRPNPSLCSDIALLTRPIRNEDTHYFSMRTREALLVVLVRTRPYSIAA